MITDKYGCANLRQIENEYGNIDSAYGAAAQSYIKWSASMALSLDTGVPWVMCQQSDAPDPIVSFLFITHIKFLKYLFLSRNGNG